jgi:prepilin-type N-terminal cleavage/methylation domain-containing protein
MINKRGFTIVELLIVIVVIAILAAISIVSYNGIQTRAENTKTISATAAWVEALQLYKIDNGNYPPMNSCLGDTNTYSDTHNGRCWGQSGDGTWFVNPGFLSQMSTYVSSYPIPSNKDVNANSGGNQFRGAMYFREGNVNGSERVYVHIIGGTSPADCPAISGLGTSTGGANRVNGRSCYYSLPQ